MEYGGDNAQLLPKSAYFNYSTSGDSIRDVFQLQLTCASFPPSFSCFISLTARPQMIPCYQRGVRTRKKEVLIGLCGSAFALLSGIFVHLIWYDRPTL